MENDIATAEGILTVVKFHTNADTDSKNEVISRTLGKFGVVSNLYKGVKPKPEEFWLARIVKNIKPDMTQGCFILEPLKKVYYKNNGVGKLLKNMYTVANLGPVLTIITPMEEFKNSIWQLSLEDRKAFKGRTVIVKQYEDVLNINYEDLEGKDDCKK